MQTKDKSHKVRLMDQLRTELIYEDDQLRLLVPGALIDITPEVARQIKMIIDLFLIDQYQV